MCVCASVLCFLVLLCPLVSGGGWGALRGVIVVVVVVSFVLCVPLPLSWGVGCEVWRWLWGGGGGGGCVISFVQFSL